VDDHGRGGVFQKTMLNGGGGVKYCEDVFDG